MGLFKARFVASNGEVSQVLFGGSGSVFYQTDLRIDQWLVLEPVL
jgi:hypothetical protein